MEFKSSFHLIFENENTPQYLSLLSLHLSEITHYNHMLNH
jgi:hypothetical protein